MPTNIKSLARFVMTTFPASLSLVVILLCALHTVPANAQTIALPASTSASCQTVDFQNVCDFYNVTPGEQLLVSGSGFGNDTSVALQTIGSDDTTVLATTTCLATGGSFSSCTWVVPDVPDSQQNGNQTLRATGTPGGEIVTLNLNLQSGVGIYPTSGPPGTVVQVYGSGYVGHIKFVFDTAAAITFGTQQAGLVNGTGPYVVYNQAPNNLTCIPSDGSLNDNGPCTFVVPGYLPGTYNVGVWAGLLWGTPDVFACGTPWCVSTFTITAPALTAVVPAETQPGLTISVAGSSFAAVDTSAVVNMNGTIVTPSGGCPFSTSNPGTIVCAVVVPSNATAPGPHSVTVIGIPYGDYASGQVVVPGSYPLTLSSQQATPGSTITVSGLAFDPRDTSAGIQIDSRNVTPSSGCPVTFGAFSCQITVPTVLAAGLHNLQATGNVANDFDLANLTVVGSLALNPQSAPVGAHVNISGVGLSSQGSTVSATFNGQSLQLTQQAPATQVNGNTVPGFATTGASCPELQGAFPESAALGFTCYFTVPMAAITGANTVMVTDNTGQSATAIFSLTPSAVLSSTQGPTGAVVTVTGYGFPPNQNVTLNLGNIVVNNPSQCNPPLNGALSCTFTVPDMAPGNYTLNAIASNNVVVTSTSFTVVPAFSPGTVAAAAGATVTVQANGFSPSDQSVLLSLNNYVINATSCALARTSPSSNFVCTFTVPDVAPGTYLLKGVGGVSGTVAIGGFTVSGITISPAFGQENTLIEVKGFGFNTNDAAASFSLSGVSAPDPYDEVNFRNGCAVAGGTFDCKINAPLTVGGLQPLVATGNAGDSASAPFEVAPETFIVNPFPAQGPIGTPVSAIGHGFLASDTSVTASLDGQNISSCSASAGSFSCSPLFTVPSTTSLGAHAIILVGSSGQTQDTVILTFTVTPGVSLSVTQGMVGQTVNVTGTGFAPGDTSATVYFELGVPSNPGGGLQVTSCAVSNGALSSCSFVVPGTISSGQVEPNNGYAVVVTGSSGDQGYTGFTVNAIQLAVSPGAGQIGSSAAVSGGGFSFSDTTATLAFSLGSNNQVAVGPAAGCSVVGGALTPCSFTVPTQLSQGAVLDSGRTGLPYTVVATGNTGDQLSVSFSAQATFAISSSTLTQGGSLIVSGSGFPCGAGAASVPCASMPLSAGSAVPGTLLTVTPNSCPISATTGQFSCSITFAGFVVNPPAPGNYILTGNIPPNVNAPFTLVVPVATTLSLTSTATPILGQFNTLTATIFPAAATGTVVFYDGVTLLGTAPLSGGQATLKMASLAFGPHSLKAIYPEVAPYGTTSATLYETIGAVTSGSFTSGSTSAVDNTPGFVATGDFNGDGVADLAIANSGANDISILIGNGDGTFRTAVNYASGGNGPTGIAIADINGDGLPDLAVSNGSGGNVTLLAGNGDGTFKPAVQLATGASPSVVVTGDFNADGIADLAFTNHGSNIVSVLIGTGGGAFQTAVPYQVPDQPSGLVVADMNGDGIADLVVTSLGAGNDLSVLIGNGNGAFQPPAGYSTGPSAGSIGVGDFNGDGNADLAVISGDGVQVFIGKGDGTLLGAVNYASNSSGSVVTVADLDGDGKADLAIANNDGTVGALLGQGDGTFGTATYFAAGRTLAGLAAADFNGDGRTDIAAVDKANSDAVILSGQALASTKSALGGVNPFSTYGQPFTVTLTVTGTGFRPTTPTGAATLFDGGEIVATSSQTSSPYTLTTTTLSGGSQTLTGSYGGDSQNAPSVSFGASVSVATAAQTITFNQPAAQTYGEAPFTPNATASSGLVVTFTSNSPSVCSATNSTVVTITGVGTCSVTAMQNGNANYNAAASVTQTFNVGQEVNTITFNQPPTHTYGDAAFTLSLTASSGLAVTLTSNSTSVCTVVVATVTILHAGTCSLTASQAGTANIIAATAVTQSFTVNQATPALTWPAPAAINYGTSLGAIQLNATTTIPGTFVYTPSAGTVLLVGTGRTLAVTFTPTDTTDYVVSSASTTINVNPAPQYTLNVAVTPANGGAITATIGGQPFSCSSNCSSVGNNSTSALTLTAVPAAGYAFTSWTSCPSASGTSCTVTLTGNITVSAVFTGSNTLTYTQGALVQNRTTGLYSRSVTVTNSGPAIAASAYVADGLPAGVSLVNASGLTSATTPVGSPYMELGAIGANSSITATIQFSRTASQAVTYTTRILGAGPR